MNLEAVKKIVAEISLLLRILFLVRIRPLELRLLLCFLGPGVLFEQCKRVSRGGFLRRLRLQLLLGLIRVERRHCGSVRERVESSRNGRGNVVLSLA